jgi:hypothetical protein
MVLDISRVSPGDLLIDVLLELGEDLLHGFVEDASESVHSASMCHSHSDILDS